MSKSLKFEMKLQKDFRKTQKAENREAVILNKVLCST